MATFEEFPDSEALAIAILLEGDFGDFSPHIGHKLPADAFTSTGTDQVITVTRTGGLPTERHRIDHPNLDISVWATNKGDARTIAGIARVTLHKAEETQVFTTPVSAVITAVEDSLGLQYMFDALNLRPRYVFAVNFTVHNNT